MKEIEKIYIRNDEDFYSISNDFIHGIVVNVPKRHDYFGYDQTYYGISTFFEYAYINGYTISKNHTFILVKEKKSIIKTIFKLFNI